MGVLETVGEGAWVAVSTIGDFVASSLMVVQETRDNVAREARNTTQPYLNLGPAGIFVIGSFSSLIYGEAAVVQCVQIGAAIAVRSGHSVKVATILSCQIRIKGSQGRIICRL